MENPTLFKWAINMPTPLSRGKLYFYVSRLQANLPLDLEGTQSLFSKAVESISILIKIIGSKGNQCLCLQEMKNTDIHDKCFVTLFKWINALKNPTTLTPLGMCKFSYSWRKTSHLLPLPFLELMNLSYLDSGNETKH